MTREEAKNVLRLYNNQKFGIVSPEFWEAIAVAIASLESDPNAPDWSQAPEWAQWYAVDADGQTNWFEKKPEKIRSNWYASDGIHQTVINSMKLLKRPDL